jgi:uncharacterized protein
LQQPRPTPAPKLDHRAPLVLDTRELGRRAGSMRRMLISAPAPERLGLELIAVPAGAPLEIELRLEAVMEGVLVTGEVTVPLVGECGRCLDALDDELTVQFQELFAYDDHLAPGTGGDDLPRLDGDLLDIEPALRDAVLLALPLTPLCDPECAGLCGQCGIRLADEPNHSHEAVDARWGALSTLAFPTGGPAAPDKEV